MSKRKEYKWIIPSKEEPNFAKSSQFRSPSQKIVDEFLSAVKGGEIEPPVKVKVPPGKDPAGQCRGIGKVFKSSGHEEFTCRLDVDKKLWIVKR